MLHRVTCLMQIALTDSALEGALFICNAVKCRAADSLQKYRIFLHCAALPGLLSSPAGQAACAASPAVCLWLQVWARRLNLSAQPDGLTARMQAALVAHLAQTGVLVSLCFSCRSCSKCIPFSVFCILQALLRGSHLTCNQEV